MRFPLITVQSTTNGNFKSASHILTSYGLLSHLYTLNALNIEPIAAGRTVPLPDIGKPDSAAPVDAAEAAPVPLAV